MTLDGATWTGEYDDRGVWITGADGGQVFLSLDDLEKLRQSVRLARLAASSPWDDAVFVPAFSFPTLAEAR